MGRVYAVDADESKGEIQVRGKYQVFSLGGVKIPIVKRVEFDADTDEGFATVTAAMRDSSGGILSDHQKNEVCWVKFHTWVQVVKPGEPEPKPNPDRMLWMNADGTATPGDDPIPEVPFQLVERGA